MALEARVARLEEIIATHLGVSIDPVEEAPSLVVNTPTDEAQAEIDKAAKDAAKASK